MNKTPRKTDGAWAQRIVFVGLMSASFLIGTGCLCLIMLSVALLVHLLSSGSVRWLGVLGGSLGALLAMAGLFGSVWFARRQNDYLLQRAILREAVTVGSASRAGAMSLSSAPHGGLSATEVANGQLSMATQESTGDDDVVFEFEPNVSIHEDMEHQVKQTK